MHLRKLQLIAGSTYTVSLPKDWVERNQLKAKSDIALEEMGDNSLRIIPSTNISVKGSSDIISLDVESYGDKINQVLFATYYLGAERIRVYSEKGIDIHTRNNIKNIVNYLSGTEIMYEDMNTIKIKILLDKSKLDIAQILFRVGLIIGISINSIIEEEEINFFEIQRNEDEIDRLYHLLAKMVYLPLVDSSALDSSGLSNNVYVLPYFLVCKRLENIADSIYEVALYLRDNSNKRDLVKSCLAEVGAKTSNYLSLLTSKKEIVFGSISMSDLNDLAENIKHIKDNNLKLYLTSIIRYIVDIQEELIHMAFYRRLIKENIL